MMKNTKRTLKVIIGFILILSLLVATSFVSSIPVFATTNIDNFVSNEISKEEKIEIKKYETVIDKFVEPIFGDRSISSCEYIYNLDDSADYIYVEFEKGGYAIYAKETMEMMEYNLQGNLPYTDSNASKYYAGPTNYFYKNENNQFVDVITGNKVEILEDEIKSLSTQIRKSITNENATKYTGNTLSLIEEETINKTSKNNSSARTSSAPDIDTENLIIASTTSGYLIPNYNYFTTKPIIGRNANGETYGNGNSGTCGPIAAQLLLGYNNYFNDRRIIEDRFLHGYDYASNTVTNINSNPNYCPDPMAMSNFTTGTTSFNAEPNNFYLELVNRIMEPNTSGSEPVEVKEGIEDYLSERLSSSGYTVDYDVEGWWFGYSPMDSSIIKEELDAGRPLIISLLKNLCGINHFVVGYGYQNYTYADGSGTYDGYVVHSGWSNDNCECIWINSAWCDGYISLNINHTHNYYTVGTIPGTSRTEYKCSTCGHRTDAFINMTTTDLYVERVATLPQNSCIHKDYYVKFATAGRKMFQTFGTKNVTLSLYNAENNQLAIDDNDGYMANSMFYYTVEANKTYRLRVEFNYSTTTGDAKIAITPASVEYSTYENIWNVESTSASYVFSTSLNTTRVLTFKPTESGTYTFRTNYEDETRIDTYLYVIDPYTTTACLYNDDGAGDLQALITMDLTTGRSYFIVVSTYNIATTSGRLSLTVNKVS